VKEIIIGTRGSDLALWQATYIKKQLEGLTSIPIRLEIIKTQGDKIDHLSFEQMEGKGFFTKELEEALLDGRIDLAVHSLKDLMTTMPDGLKLAAVGFREDNREAVLIREESYDPDLPLGVRKAGIIGSSSVRRQSQIVDLRSDLSLKDLRGNVPTRINKLRDRQYDAIILAFAGIKRLELDLSDVKMLIQEAQDFLPAPGQGILGIQTGAGNKDVNDLIAQLDDPAARIQTQLERGLLAHFEGGCQLPLGAYSEVSGDEYSLHAVLGHRREKRWIGLARASVSGKNIEVMIDDVYKDLTAQVESFE
jgi:hydroxymethylbilane synthase